MSAVFEVDPSRPGEAAEAIDAATSALSAGALAVFPTETVYGIASRPDDPAATTRLFDAKRRPASLRLPVLAPSVEDALELVVADETARRLAEAFWPGPLTMVLPRSRRSMDWQLGERSSAIGVRVPDHLFSLALLQGAGPLAATSANVSGLAPLSSLAALQQAFGEAVAVYVVARAGTEAPEGMPSTVVDLTGEELRVLRHGPIPASRLAEFMQSVH